MSDDSFARGSHEHDIPHLDGEFRGEDAGDMEPAGNSGNPAAALFESMVRDYQPVPGSTERPALAFEEIMGMEEEKAPAEEQPVPVGDQPAVERAVADRPVVAVAADTPEARRAKEIEEIQKKFPKLEADELKRSRYLQQTLLNLAGLYVEVPRAGIPGKEEEDRQKLIAAVTELKTKLLLEQEAGVFGATTQDALKKYSSWLQSKAIPEAIKEMDSLQLAIPPGCPIGLASDRYQRSISPDLYRALASNNELKLELNVDATKLPPEQVVAKLDGIFEWLAKCNDSASDARGEHQDRVLNKLLSDMGLPKGWQRKDGENPATWRASAAEMIDLSTRMRNYVEAMQTLYKASTRTDFPLELPSGTRLIIEANGRTHEVTDKDLADPSKKRLLKDGKIKEIKLDLPEDLRQDSPANAQKIERMRDWMKRHGDKIDQAVKELVDLENNPQAVIMYGDQEIRNGKGRFNANGEFLGIVDPVRYKLQAGETLKDVNLIGYDFEVEEIKDGPNKGKFKISQTINAENAPWYAYQNYRCCGIEKVGKMVVQEKIVDADAFVPVRNGDKIEIMKAKNLGSFKTGQQVSYWVEKGLITTMDAAMLVSGGIEVSVAARGACLASTGARAGLRLAGGELAWEVTKGLTRVTVAGAGILNNAGGRSLMWGDWRVGEAINTARGLYFLGDISLGLARGGWALFKAGKAAESLSSAEKVHTLIHGRKAVEGVEALKGIPFVRQVHTGTHIGFKATEYLFAPVIIGELNHQWTKISELGQRDPAKDAPILIGDGRGLQSAEKGAFDPRNKKSLEGARAVLDGYAATLKDGRADAPKTKIQEIVDETKKLLGPDAKAEDRKAFLEKMLAEATFTGEDIRDMEAAHPSAGDEASFRLTDQQLYDLRDPEKRRLFPKAVQEVAERILSGKNPDVQAMARISMLYLSRNADGKIAENLAQIKVRVPDYERDVTVYTEDGSYTYKAKIAARDGDVKMSANDAVGDLKRDLESKTLGNRGIVTGEALTRIGALTHQQFGGVLQDVLRSKDSTKEDRMRALTDAYGARFSTIIDGVRYQEGLPTGEMTAVERQRLQGQQFGLSSKDMIATLQNVAKTDKDPDVRALAAAQLYGINERDPRRRAEILSGVNTLVQNSTGKEAGDFAKKAAEFLKKEMEATIPAEAQGADWVKERRLNAAAALALVAPETDKDLQKAINKAIVDSFSTTNPSVMVRAVEMMLPDRIKQLTTDDAAAATRFRAAVVGAIKLPESRAQEEGLVRVLQKIEPLLAGGERDLKQQLQKQLEGVLTNNAFNKDYAEHYPSLRAAAVSSLADMGAQGSLDIIRSHASAQPKLKVGDKEIAANEPDARVRYAAIRALERMRDTDMRAYVAELIDKETDPSVATQLRDIRFAQQRLEPESREYKEAYEAALKDLINPFNQTKYPYLKNWGEDSAVGWLNQHFPLLNVDTFRDRAQDAVNNATSWGFRRTSLTATIELEEWKKAAEVHDQRVGEWKKLEELSKGTGEQADKARMALYYIMTSTRVGGLMGATEGLTVHIKGYYRDDQTVYKFYNFDWQAFSARALVQCAKTGCASRDLTAHIVEMALGYTAGLRTDTSAMHLLDAMKELAKPSTGAGEPANFNIAREKLARVYAKALELELKRPQADQREWYQAELVRELKGLQHRMMFPVFQALSERSPFEGVKRQAAATLTEMRDSVAMMWNETLPDQTSDAATRATKLRTALEDKKNAEKSVQEIFNAYKGYDLSDAKDPGLPHLQVALNDNNERVRLAAAKILMDSKLPNNNPVKAKAIQALADLIVTGSALGYRSGAFAELSKLQIDRPLHMMLPGGRLLKLEKIDGKIQGTEFTGDKQTGRIYSNGGGFRYITDNKGTLTQVWEDGIEHKRKKQGDQFIDEWDRPAGYAVWKGQFQVNADGTYWYQATNNKDRWNRAVSGAWTKTVMN